MKKKIIESINIEAKRWFQKSYGNTYHTVKLNVTTTTGESFEIHSKIHYGYGSHYLVTAKNLLEKFGFENPADTGAVWKSDCIDVDRKKDLKHFDSQFLPYVVSTYE